MSRQRAQQLIDPARLVSARESRLERRAEQLKDELKKVATARNRLVGGTA